MRTESEIEIKLIQLKDEKLELEELVKAYGWQRLTDSIKKRYDNLSLKILILNWVLDRGGVITT